MREEVPHRNEVNMLLTQLLKSNEYFSSIDKIIASFILDKGEDLENETVRSIANKTYVSPATVIRFFQRLGYSGYRMFKQDYLSELKYFSSHFQNIDPNIPFQQKDDERTITNKLAALFKETIEDVLSLMDYAMLHKALYALKRAEIIYIYSAGAQIGICDIFKDKMIKIGKNVIVSNVIDELYYHASFTQKENTFILVSYSGETRNVLDIAAKLRKRGVSFIAITSYGNHGLSKYSDCCLYASTREKINAKIGDFGFNISVLFLMDLLYSYYFSSDYFVNYQNRKNYLTDFEKNRGSVKKIIRNPILKDDD